MDGGEQAEEDLGTDEEELGAECWATGRKSAQQLAWSAKRVSGIRELWGRKRVSESNRCHPWTKGPWCWIDKWSFVQSSQQFPTKRQGTVEKSGFLRSTKCYIDIDDMRMLLRWVVRETNLSNCWSKKSFAQQLYWRKDAGLSWIPKDECFLQWNPQGIFARGWNCLLNLGYKSLRRSAKTFHQCSWHGWRVEIEKWNTHKPCPVVCRSMDLQWKTLGMWKQMRPCRVNLCTSSCECQLFGRTALRKMMSIKNCSRCRLSFLEVHLW